MFRNAKASTKHVELEAIVFPPCQHCNSPYKPSRPIENYGTIYFRSDDWIANALFGIERVIQRLRVARLRNK